MQGKRIYIAGKMKGLTAEQIATKFNTMEAKLIEQGFEVFNPLKIIQNTNTERVDMNLDPLTESESRRVILGVLIFHLSSCDELHMMPCWQDSPGAQLERHFAMSTGLPIVYH